MKSNYSSSENHFAYSIPVSKVSSPRPNRYIEKDTSQTNKQIETNANQKQSRT